MKKFLQNWNNLLTIPCALAIWFASPILLRALDKTAGCFDAGTLQIYLFALMGVLIADAVAWVCIWLSWPTLHMETKRFWQDFTATSETVRVLCVISVFALHFLGFLLLCRAM